MRALIGVAMFASAYMAEVVRGGFAAVPRGQYEAAQALGLTYWRMMALVILPQALRVTLPNIVNTFIALFKDTTLVFVVGIFDFLRTIEAARVDPNWATPNHQRHRLRFCRAILLHLLLWHVALRPQCRSAARPRAPALKGLGLMDDLDGASRADEAAPDVAVEIDRPAQMVRRISRRCATSI